MQTGACPHSAGEGVNSFCRHTRLFNKLDCMFQPIIIRRFQFLRPPSDQRTETRNPPTPIDFAVENSRTQPSTYSCKRDKRRSVALWQILNCHAVTFGKRGTHVGDRAVVTSFDETDDWHSRPQPSHRRFRSALPFLPD